MQQPTQIAQLSRITAYSVAEAPQYLLRFGLSNWVISPKKCAIGKCRGGQYNILGGSRKVRRAGDRHNV